MVCIGALCACDFSTENHSPSYFRQTNPLLESETWNLIRVIDGDTILARSPTGQREKIRLLHINAPERDEKGYTEAKNTLACMFITKRFRIAYETPGVQRRGTYGRVLGYVYVNGRNVNIAMVASGWALYWTKFGPGPLAVDFQNAQKEAHSNGRGLWNW